MTDQRVDSKSNLVIVGILSLFREAWVIVLATPLKSSLCISDKLTHWKSIDSSTFKGCLHLPSPP